MIVEIFKVGGGSQKHYSIQRVCLTDVYVELHRTSSVVRYERAKVEYWEEITQ